MISLWVQISIKFTGINNKKKSTMEKQSQKVRDLIYYFTHNKKLTRQQQARRDKLLARDCTASTEVVKDDFMNNSQKDEEDAGNPNSSDRKNRYVSPKILHSFLYKFNQDEVLKYTCHEIDTNEVIDYINELCVTKKYNFKEHSELIRKKFKWLLNDFRRDNIFLDNKFIGMLMAYIGLSNKEWSSLGIKTGWNSQDIIEWSESHEGIIPSPGRNIAKKQKNNGFTLKDAFSSNLSENRIKSFRELVIYFKSLFHIRRDNSLRKIIQYQNTNIGIEGLDITFADKDFNDGIELFTDVDKLIQAYRAILRICREANKEGNIDVELSFYESEDCIFFTIHDKNHCYGKTLKSATERIGESQTKLIQNQINGLCDLYIEADFGNNEYARIGLWTKDSNPLGEKPNISVERLDKAIGVKYILKFY